MASLLHTLETLKSELGTTSSCRVRPAFLFTVAGPASHLGLSRGWLNAPFLVPTGALVCPALWPTPRPICRSRTCVEALGWKGAARQQRRGCFRSPDRCYEFLTNVRGS